MDVILEENPFMQDYNPWYYQPRRHRAAALAGWQGSRRTHRNPIEMAKGWVQGVGGEEVLGAVGGVAAVSLLPRLFIKDTSTKGGKALLIGAGLLTTILAGMLGKAVNPRVGRAAIIGGLAGVSIAAVQSFTPLKLTEHTQLGETRVVTFPSGKSDETVNVIQP